MGKHTLDGGVVVDVISMTTSFGTQPPRFEGEGRERILTFSKPANAVPMASVKFKIRATGNTSSIRLGIKQICMPKDFQGLYEGIKDINGSISLETKGFNDVRFLDIASTELKVLFDARNNATGAQAFAAHAPFYSETPVFVRPGSEIEIGAEDHPGANFRLELQNGATDRPNFLSRVRMRSEFATALVVAKLDSAGRAVSHTPLEGVRWRAQSFASITWNGNTPNLEQPRHQAIKTEDLPTISSDGEFDIFRNISLTVTDCIPQKFNDGLFAAKGQFERQDFSKPTGRLTAIGSKGVVYIQFPVIAN